MKNLIGILIVLIFFTFEVYAHDWKVVSPDKLAESGSKIYEVDEDGEINVRGVLVKRIEIGKEKCIFSLFNKSEVAIKPDFHVNLFNKYGVKTGFCRIMWLFDKVKPGGKESESVDLEIYPLVEMFENTSISMPRDFGKSMHAVFKVK